MRFGLEQTIAYFRNVRWLTIESSYYMPFLPEIIHLAVPLTLFNQLHKYLLFGVAFLLCLCTTCCTGTSTERRDCAHWTRCGQAPAALHPWQQAIDRVQKTSVSYALSVCIHEKNTDTC